MRTHDEIQSWRQDADHYAKLAGEHTDTSSQLACLILADYCVHQWSGDPGGPYQEMVQLAEEILGISVGAAPCAPPAQQSEQDLRQRILESLIIYQDGTQQCLRFCPIDTPPFRHGLSLNIKLGDHVRDREIVADYLVKCVEVLTDVRTAQEP